MKVSNTVVSVIIIAAVLVFAYALGLLIRQARTGGARPSSMGQESSPAAGPSYGPRAAQTNDTAEARAQAKDRKAEAIEKRDSLTEEDKEKFRSQVTKQVGGRRGRKGPPKLPPEERPAQEVRTQSPSEAPRPAEEAGAPASEGDSANPKPGTDKAGGEPGKAGPG